VCLPCSSILALIAPAYLLFPVVVLSNYPRCDPRAMKSPFPRPATTTGTQPRAMIPADRGVRLSARSRRRSIASRGSAQNRSGQSDAPALSPLRASAVAAVYVRGNLSALHIPLPHPLPRTLLVPALCCELDLARSPSAEHYENRRRPCGSDLSAGPCAGGGPAGVNSPLACSHVLTGDDRRRSTVAPSRLLTRRRCSSPLSEARDRREEPHQKSPPARANDPSPPLG